MSFHTKLRVLKWETLDNGIDFLHSIYGFVYDSNYT